MIITVRMLHLLRSQVGRGPERLLCSGWSGLDRRTISCATQGKAEDFCMGWQTVRHWSAQNLPMATFSFAGHGCERLVASGSAIMTTADTSRTAGTIEDAGIPMIRTASDGTSEHGT